MTDRQGALHPPPPPHVGSPDSGRPDRRPLLIAVAVLAVAALIAIAVWLTRGADEEATEDDAVPQTVTAQRRRAYVIQVKSALRNGATAMEVYGVEHSGDYSGAAMDDLAAEGDLVTAAHVTLTADPTHAGYCITANHADLPDGHPWKTATYDSDLGYLSERDKCS